MVCCTILSAKVHVLIFATFCMCLASLIPSTRIVFSLFIQHVSSYKHTASPTLVVKIERPAWLNWMSNSYISKSLWNPMPQHQYVTQGKCSQCTCMYYTSKRVGSILHSWENSDSTDSDKMWLSCMESQETNGIYVFVLRCWTLIFCNFSVHLLILWDLVSYSSSYHFSVMTQSVL